MDAAVFGDRLPEVTQFAKAFQRPFPGHFAVPELRELECASSVSIS